MSGRMKIAAKLIQDLEFEMAQQVLEKKIDNQQALYWLSLLHRYNDNYTKEKLIVDSALKIDNSDQYMQQRQKWHSLPYFEKYEPRKCPQLPDSFSAVDSTHIKQLTVVTGGDSNVFTQIYECIESIRNTKFYKDVEIAVLDSGLTEKDKSTLKSKFNISQFYDVYEILKKHLDPKIKTFQDIIKSGKLRTLIGQIGVNQSIQTRYMLWIEPDIWVQDERSFNLLFEKTLKYGAAAIEHVCRGNIGRVFHMFPEEKINTVISIKNEKAIAGGLYCIDLNRGSFFKYAMTYINNFLMENGYQDFCEELAVQTGFYSYESNAESVLERFHNYSYISMFLNEDNYLIDPNYNKIIGLYHYVGSETKARAYQYTLPKKFDDGHVGQAIRSIRYRDLPWQDKPEILSQLLKEVQICLDA